jgi:hypothetical protein
LQNKILNGEGEKEEEEETGGYEVVEAEAQKVTPQNNPTQNEQQDFTEMLDNYPSDRIDPDYSGPSEDEEEEGEEEHKSTLEEEQVDIN